MERARQLSFFSWFIEIFFARIKKNDDFKCYPNWRMGLSSAASWSWGVSLAFGMNVMQTKGMLPFIIWTVGNILAIPFFGFVRTYLPLSKKWPDFIFPIVIIFLFVEFFCVVLNLQGLLNGFGGAVKGISTYEFFLPETSKLIVLCTGIFIVWYVKKGGLRISVLTDLGQYFVQLVAVIVLALYGFYLGGSNEIVWVKIDPVSGKSGLEWAKFGFWGIIVGVICAGHHWQRFSVIKEKNILRVSLWGGTFFGLYMLFVAFAGFYYQANNIILGSLFLVIMIALSSSSIDSAVAGMEYVAAKFHLKPYWGTILATIAVFAWYFYGSEKSLVQIWTFMAKIRLPIILFLIGITIFVTIYKRIRKNSNTVKN